MTAAESALWRGRVHDLLVHGRLNTDAIDTIVEAGLAGYAKERWTEGVPDAATAEALGDPRMRQAQLLQAARHASARRAVADLIGVWRSSGIEALLFKGFYLSEFVYPNASIRLYSDVDVALRSLGGLDQRQVASESARLAREHGWRVDWYLGEPDSATGHHDVDYDGHELVLLHHEPTGTSLDAHRRLIHKNANRSRRRDVGDQITEAVWAAATPAELVGAAVRLPQPVDAALVGLIAARSWSGDRYRLRPHDLLDLEALMTRGSFGLAALHERSAELGLAGTTRLFLRRCDPVGRRIDLSPPGPLEVLAYDTLLLPERGHRGLEQWWARTSRLPEQVRAVATAWPGVSRQVRRRRAGQPLDWQPVGPESVDLEPVDPEPVSVRSVAAAAAGRLERRSWLSLQLGVRRALKLHGITPEDDRELALTSLHGCALRSGFVIERVEEGGEVYFLSGTQRLPVSRLFASEEDAGAVRTGDPPGLRGRHPGAQGPAGRHSGDRAKVNTTAASMRTAGNLLRRANEVGFAGLRLRLEALLLLRRVVRRLEGTPFKSLHAELIDPKAGSAAVGGPHPEALTIGRATESAARFVPQAMCVAQSLAAQAMLNRRGVASVIHFGFKRDSQGAVEGHAWLEADGAVITGDVGLDDFTRTATFEG